MADGTICAVLALVEIILLVAGITVGRGAFEDTVQVAGFTFGGQVLANQLEGR
jgi:hypothetical protein